MYAPGTFSSNINMEIFSTVRFELINNLVAYEPSEEKE